MLPNGLSQQDASALIVNAEQAIFDGKAITNRKAKKIVCKKCNVEMPLWVKYCPKCSMEMAVPVDLNAPKQSWWRKLDEDTRNALIGFVIIGGCGFLCGLGITVALKIFY